MQKVGIKDLKNNLSFYINKAGKGENILVTNRNDVVAEITSPLITGKKSLLSTYLEEQRQKGSISPVSPGKIAISKKPRKNLKKINYLKIYEETRSDRI